MGTTKGRNWAHRNRAPDRAPAALTTSGIDAQRLEVSPAWVELSYCQRQLLAGDIE